MDEEHGIRMEPPPCLLKDSLGCPYITWLWGERRHFGYWWVWISRWMTWFLQAGGEGCTQMVWWIPLWILCCSWLGMSDKHREELLEVNLFHVSHTGHNCVVIKWQPADSLNAWLKMATMLTALTWFRWTWNSKVLVSMLMLDKFPNGNLGNQKKIIISKR